MKGERGVGTGRVQERGRVREGERGRVGERERGGEEGESVGVLNDDAIPTAYLRQLFVNQRGEVRNLVKVNFSDF